MILVSNIKHLSPQADLMRLRDIISAHVCEWASCDTICGQVVHPLLVRFPEAADIVAEWSEQEPIFVKRAACVSFVKLAKKGKHNDVIIRICSKCVKFVPLTTKSSLFQGFGTFCPTWGWMGFKRTQSC